MKKQKRHYGQARKRGKDWYLGTISNEEEHILKLPLGFLGEGKFRAEIFADAPDTDIEPNHLIKTVLELDSHQTLTLKLGKGGGQAIHFMAI